MTKDVLPEIEKIAEKENKDVNEKIIEMISTELLLYKNTGLSKLIEELKKAEHKGM